MENMINLSNALIPLLTQEGVSDIPEEQKAAVCASPLKLNGGLEGLCITVAVWMMGLLFFSSAFAVQASPTVQLPQTGQTKCYDTAGTEIDCAGTGQDGDKKMGVAWASDIRFTVGTGAQADCVTDNLTGLMWVKTPDSTMRTQQEAIDYTTGLDLCGFTDWRVPSVIELESMTNADQSNSVAWLNTQGFSNVQSFGYWSSTTTAGSAYSAWDIRLLSDWVDNYNRTYNNYVWPVRGGQTAAPADIWASGQKTCYNTSGTVITCAGTKQDGDIKPGAAWTNPRFTKNINGTVTDNLTGLIWLTNANCFGTMTWDQALASANSLANAQCDLTDGSQAGDWRLPNRKELLSLVDFEYSNPALSNADGTTQWGQGDPFDNVQSYFYWSSTTGARNPDEAWYIYIGNGFVGYYYKTANNYIWPVRGGQAGSLDNLTISKTGSGTVTVDKGTINWSGNLGTAGYIHGIGTGVTMTATPDAGSTFSGWSGDADCSDGQVTMNSDVSCTATFTLNQHNLTVHIDPASTGSGTVGGGGSYYYGTIHQITATADPGSIFTGWSGDCSGSTTPFDVTMIDRDMTCTATFLPGIPIVTATTPTKNTKPTWTWISGGGGNGNFRYRLDNPVLTAGATTTTLKSYTPFTALTAGKHTLYVQEQNSAGLWSVNGSKLVLIDTALPINGTLTATPGAGQIALSWSSFSDGSSGSGIGTYKVVFAIGTAPTNCSTGTPVYTGTDTKFTHTGLSNLTYGYRVCAIDNAGNVSTGTTKSAKPLPAETDPPTGSIQINGGVAAYTRSAAVALTLAAGDASLPIQMCISNTTTCSSWIAYATSKSWTLTTGTGIKTVNVWYRDVWGNATPLATPYKATIVLDAIAPTNGTLKATPDAGSIKLNWSGFSDGSTGSGIASYKVVFATGTAPANCSIGTPLYTGTDMTYTHTGLSNLAYGYRVCAIDNAGNMSTGASSSTRPLPGETDPPTGKITINGGDAATNSASVTLTLIASDASLPIQMCISNTTTCTTWKTFAPTNSWTLTTGAGTKNVNVWFKDAWGNTTPTPYSASIVLDITAPADGTVTATPGNHQVTLNWDGFTDIGSGIRGYLVKYAAGSVPASCTSGTTVPGYDGSSRTCTHTSATNGMSYGYRVCAIDNAGNMSTGAIISAIPEACLLTGTWNSSDKPFITMSLTQTGNQIIGSWQNSNTGCVYTGSGAYDSNSNAWSIAFDTSMDPFNCAPHFTYSGTVNNCTSLSFWWTNSYGYGGSRQY